MRSPFSILAIPEFCHWLSPRAHSPLAETNPQLLTRSAKALKDILKPIAIIGVCLSLGGCADLTTGRDFDASRVKHIARRKTTSKMVLAMFGEPGRRYEVKPSGEGWTYSFQTAPGATVGYRKNLTVLFDKNKVVVNYWLHQGRIAAPPAQRHDQHASTAANNGTTKYLDRGPVKTAVVNQTPAPAAKQRPPSDGRNTAAATNIGKTKLVTPGPVKTAVVSQTPAPAAKQRPSDDGRNTTAAASAGKAKLINPGPVRTMVANQSSTPLTLRVERNGGTVAELRMSAEERKNLLLPHGEYGLKLKLNNQCYRAPGFSVALTAASINLIWKASNLANLRPISQAEFER